MVVGEKRSGKCKSGKEGKKKSKKEKIRLLISKCPNLNRCKKHAYGG